MKKKRIFISGGRGFIGKNLAEFFRDKYYLFIPSHSELDLLDTDKVRRYIIKNRVDYIIHAANVGGARTDFDKKNIVDTNLRMFFNIVKNEQFVKRIIIFGSGAEYDKSRLLKQVAEEEFDKRVPTDDYGFYKYICSKYILNLNSKKIVALRLFGIYGPYENYLVRFISNSILKNLLRQPIVINQNVFFDYLYILDLMKIVDYFLNNSSKYNIYNAVSGKKTDLLSIVRIINEIGLYRSKIKIIYSGLNYEYTASNKKLMSEIKFFQVTSLREGIRKLYRWYQMNLDKIDRKKVINDEYIKLCGLSEISC